MRPLTSILLASLLVTVAGCPSLESLNDQDQFDLELFNDSDDPIHLLVDGEARAPSNRLAPGQARVVTARFERGETILITAQNSLGVDVFTGCRMVDEPFTTQSGSVAYTSGAPFLECSGNAFE